MQTFPSIPIDNPTEKAFEIAVFHGKKRTPPKTNSPEMNAA
jgi:hypothetical protein